MTRAFARDREPLGVDSGTVLAATVRCFEEAPLNTPDLGQRMRSAYPAALTDAGIFNDPILCDGLHPFRAGPEHFVLADSEIPALIITGEFDVQTHRSNGEIVARALKHSQLVEFPGAAHLPSWRTECARTIMRGFYNAPLQTVDVTCVKSLPPLRFITDVKALVK